VHCSRELSRLQASRKKACDCVSLSSLGSNLGIFDNIE
jgi:hypothetical protein